MILKYRNAGKYSTIMQEYWNAVEPKPQWLIGIKRAKGS